MSAVEKHTRPNQLSLQKAPPVQYVEDSLKSRNQQFESSGNPYPRNMAEKEEGKKYGIHPAGLWPRAQWFPLTVLHTLACNSFMRDALCCYAPLFPPQPTWCRAEQSSPLPPLRTELASQDWGSRAALPKGRQKDGNPEGKSVLQTSARKTGDEREGPTSKPRPCSKLYHSNTSSVLSISRNTSTKAKGYAGGWLLLTFPVLHGASGLFMVLFTMKFVLLSHTVVSCQRWTDVCVFPTSETWPTSEGVSHVLTIYSFVQEEQKFIHCTSHLRLSQIQQRNDFEVQLPQQISQFIDIYHRSLELGVIPVAHISY